LVEGLAISAPLQGLFLLGRNANLNTNHGRSSYILLMPCQ
jgi:hypothetical protein